MGEINKELLQIFVEEALEHVGDMEQELLAIEENGAQIDGELVNKVFRSAHTIKGNAGYVGLEQIATLAHRMEDVMGLIRKARLIPNAENMNPLLLASDAHAHAADRHPLQPISTHGSGPGEGIAQGGGDRDDGKIR